MNNRTTPWSDERRRIAEVYGQRADLAADGRYSLLHPENLYRVQQLERALLDALRTSLAQPLSTCEILDVGCGSGSWIRELIRWGATPGRIHGVDLLEDRIAMARTLTPAGVTFRCDSAAQLDFPDASFDIVTQFTVFTSVLDSQLRRCIADEMRRVLRPDGVILWYDFHFDNPRNPDVRRVTIREVRDLFADCDVRVKRLSLAPPIASRVTRRSLLLYQLLSGIPWLCTHHLAAIRRTDRPRKP